MQPRVYIVILNYNNPEYTINCLTSIYKLRYNNYCAIVVDDASNDKSVEIINE